MSISVGQKWGKCVPCIPCISQEKDRIQFWDKVFINCVTILPFDLKETQYDLESGTSESMSGYTLVGLDILSEETCMKKMKVHGYDYDKYNIKNIICSKTNAIAIQKVKEHVSMYCIRKCS